MKQSAFTCIVCPKSCVVTVTDEEGKLSFSGYECKRGITHAENEHLHPMRMLTTTVKVEGGIFNRLGVVGTKEVPKAKLRECLDQAYRVVVTAPVNRGDVIIPDICGTGCDLVAAMSMKQKS